ncbi:hypothetical protein F4811DRAFT_540750 [Daldinia bambusicola]|nr:hypothetical protein F4811DRAFT_540750 [Daldinia bambusicola]
MAKPKSLMKQPKQKSKKEQKLESVDDFQAAGVEFEEAAGKWRAGDAAKSMRFFRRAIDVYDQGLRKFPRSVDLAYNKARVQLEIATHPILVDQLEQPLKAVLEEALASHRYTLELDPENTDALFNQSQVLTAIAELIASDEDGEGAGNEAEALKALREALDLQRLCLTRQERKYQEFLELERFADEENMSEKPTQASASKEASESSGAEEDDGWFNVVEPVTIDTLLDTLLAQMGTLTTFCSVLSGSPEQVQPGTLAWAEEVATGLVEKIQTLSREKQDRLQEIALARANLISAMLEAAYRTGQMNAEAYGRELNSAFSNPDLQLDSFVDGLMAKARSFLALSSAIADIDNEDARSQSTMRWNVLTASIASLKSASAMRGISQEDLASTHLLRGDASLYLYSMAFPPLSHQTAVNTASQNAKNAEVYYRNASRLTSDEEERDVASLKSMVAQYLQAYSQGNVHGDISGLLGASPRGHLWVMQQLEDMVAENLVPQALLS